MQSSQPLDLVGIGIGPFNLSLAALLDRTPGVRSLFVDRKRQFDWHPEIMFSDSEMQTCYLKDLVSPVDPTNPHSFLNFLVKKGLFHSFLNTQRRVVLRREFEQYCQWVSHNLGDKLCFDAEVRSVDFDGDAFRIQSGQGELRSSNLCVATGLEPSVPDFARACLGPKVFHAKSPLLGDIDLSGKSVVIVGGGQTGLEIFANALRGKWGRVGDLRILTRRSNLEPLDESAFTNEYFTPDYVGAFWGLDQAAKDRIVANQKLASDGNTPAYLSALYSELYRLKHVEGDTRDLKIMACRKVVGIAPSGDGYRLGIENTFTGKSEELGADLVILSTGFKSVVPRVLEPLFPRIARDDAGRLRFKKTYAIEWDGPADRRIYALNYSRHNHGIADPQTSLMAWRSANVVNDLVGRPVYSTGAVLNFVDFGAERQ